MEPPSHRSVIHPARRPHHRGAAPPRRIVVTHHTPRVFAFEPLPPHRRRHRHGIGTASALILAAEHLSRGAAGVIIDHHRNPDAGSQEYVDNISSGQSLLDAAIALSLIHI